MSAKPVTIFSRTTGLDNKNAPAVALSARNGTTAMVEAVNIDVPDTMERVSRRKGYSPLTSGTNMHSLYGCGDYGLVVNNGDLSVVWEDGSLLALRSVNETARMDYETVANRHYYANGHEVGYVENGSDNSWDFDTYYGPTTSRQFSGPPIGRKLGYYKGRMYIAVDEFVFYSEPLAYNMFDLGNNFIPFVSVVTGICPVDDGIFFCTEGGIYHTHGDAPADFSMRRLHSTKYIEGVKVRVPGEKVSDRYSGDVWILGCDDGFFMAGGNAYFKNVTKDNLVLPDGLLYGGAGVVNDRAVFFMY